MRTKLTKTRVDALKASAHFLRTDPKGLYAQQLAVAPAET